MTGALAAGVALATVGLLPSCTSVQPRPLGAGEVTSAFGREGIRLVQQPLGAEDARWVVRLVSVDVRPPFEVQLYDEPSVARHFAEAFRAFESPPRGVLRVRGRPRGVRTRPRFGVVVRANAVVVVPKRLPADDRAAVARALARLPDR